MRPGEEPPGRRQVTPTQQQNVNALAVPIDGPIQIGPGATGLHRCLAGEPAVTEGMAARPRRLDELRVNRCTHR